MDARDFTLGFVVGGAVMALLAGFYTFALMLGAVFALMLLGMFTMTATRDNRGDNGG